MSSLVRRIHIRIMKKRGVDKVPCPYGNLNDSGLKDEKGKPILVPVFVWPKFAPPSELSA